MNRDALITPLDHAVLRGVETLPVGSAKVPRLPCLPALVEAAGVEELAAVLVAERERLEAYADALDGDGLGDMARTLRRVLGNAPRLTRLNADAAAALTWLLNAQHKTAGRATMTFAPWATRASLDPVGCVEGEEGGDVRVTLSQSRVMTMAVANAWVYERLIGRLNAAAADAAGPRPADEIAAAVATGEARGLRPRFVRAKDVKSMLKIDYKIDRDGRLVIVDVNAGLIGAWFDDLLLDATPGLAPARLRITPRLAAAVIDRYRLERGRLPRRIVLCVLDEEMHRQWAEADIGGLVAELRGHVAAVGGHAGPVAVIAADGLEAVARGERPPSLLAGHWEGVPDLMVFYSCRVAPRTDPGLLAALEADGVTLVDGAVHAAAAGKELATEEALGTGLPDGVRLPETFVLGGVVDGPGAAAAVRSVWERAVARGWGLLAVKIDKQRRATGRGDYPTAHLYPVTALGRELAERQVERVFEGLAGAAGGVLRLVVTHVDHLGGCGGGLGRRDVEVRTYAFPVLPA